MASNTLFATHPKRCQSSAVYKQSSGQSQSLQEHSLMSHHISVGNIGVITAATGCAELINMLQSNRAAIDGTVRMAALASLAQAYPKRLQIVSLLPSPPLRLFLYQLMPRRVSCDALSTLDVRSFVAAFVQAAQTNTTKPRPAEPDGAWVVWVSVRLCGCASR